MKNPRKQRPRILRSMNLSFLMILSFMIVSCADDLMNPIPLIEINPGFSTTGFSNVSVVSLNESDTHKMVYSRVYGISRELTMTLTVDESLLTAYNSENGTNYKVLPAEFYTMPGNVTFDIKSKNADFDIVFKSKQLYRSAGTVEAASQYVLPLRAVSDLEKGVDIKEESNTVLLHMNMKAATVQTVIPASPVDLYFVQESTAKEVKTVEATLNFTGIDPNVIYLEVDESASLLDDSQYTLLPVSNYSFGKPTVSSDNKLQADAEFNANGLVDGKTYLLPVRFKSSDADYVVSQSQPVYFVVNITEVQVSIEGASDSQTVTAYSSLSALTGNIVVSANSVLPEALTINMAYDPSLIAAFNEKTKSDYKTLPEGTIKITNGKIAANAKEMNIRYDIDIKSLKLAGDHYLVPLVLQKEDMEVGDVAGSEIIYLDVAKSLSGEYNLEVLANERTRNIVNTIWDATKCQRAGDAAWDAAIEKAQYGFGGDGDWYAVLFSVTDEDMPGKPNCKKIVIYTFLELLEETGGSNRVTNNNSYFDTTTGEVYIDCGVYESWFDQTYKETYSFKRK